MNINIVAPGTRCKEIATELDGMITHVLIHIGGHVQYVFQPSGLTAESGQPLERMVVELARLGGFLDSAYSEIDVRSEILGTTIMDNASGFKGMATAFVLHSSGCFHVVIQPPGKLVKTGAPIERADFDIRQCSGNSIPVATEDELAESKKKKPSPLAFNLDDHHKLSGRTALDD